MAEYDDNNINQNSINNEDKSNTTNNVNNDADSNITGNVNNDADNSITGNATNSQSQNKVPEYNFWAEQVPNGPYNNPNMNSNYNNQNNSYQGSPYQNNPYQSNSNSNNGYQSNGYQYNGYQSNSYQSNGNQNNNYQNNGYQNNGYQNSGYQGGGYQGNGYQNGYHNNPYTNYSNQGNPYQYSAYQNYTRPEKKRRKTTRAGKVIKFLAKAACFGLIAGLSFYGFQQAYYAINPDARVNYSLITDDSTYEIGYTEPGVIQTADKSLITDVADNMLPAIVSINMVATQTTQWFGQSFDQQVEGSGSGIVVGKDDKELLIATNNHVVEGATKITVTFADGTQADAIIKGTDQTADLAVVTVDVTTLTADTLKAITVAKLGNSDDVKVGEMVIAIGNALGYGQSVTVGYVSAKDREVQVTDTTGYNAKTMVLLQTDAAINPGNSGGALINMKGEVIGINTVKYASSEVEGMGYAIPISKATPIINELMTREVLTEAEKGYLGIAGIDVTEDVASFYNMPVGVYVQEVTKGGAAEKAGLKTDDIIIGADDLEITSITQLKEYVNSHRVGAEVKIKYMRNANGQYEEGTVTVTLGQNPNLNTAD